MAARNYSNIAVETDLASGINNSVTSLTVDDASGWPAAPFILILDEGEAEEELVLVGGKSGTTFSSLTRGFGGTSGQAHSGGATVKHVLSAEDLTLIWEHVHTGAAGDDTAAISHDDLDDVSDDDHHAKSHTHDGDGSGSVSHGDLDDLGVDDHTQYLKEKASGGTAAEVPEHDHSGASEAGTVSHDDLTGVSIDDHHDRDHASTHSDGGADEVDVTDLAGLASLMAELEVDGFASSNAALTTSLIQEESVSLSIPADWNSWKCTVIATWSAGADSGVGLYEVRLSIDGVVGSISNNLPAEGDNAASAPWRPASVIEHRTGLTNTGSRTIGFLARETSGEVTLWDLALYARAVRTS